MKEPKTVDEAVDVLISRFVGLSHLFEKSEDDFASFCHSQLSGGIGMQIRNEFGFWTEHTEIYHHMVNEHCLTDPDEMSDFILRRVYKKYNGL